VGAIREGYGFEDGMNLRWMEPGSPESLAEVVDSLLADEAARRRLGERARRHVVEHLGWDRYVLGIESAIAEWLGTKETAE
jgi:glycosyltransferase involved in cell wall biosynthesis